MAKSTKSEASAMSFRSIANGARTIERQTNFALAAWQDGENEAAKIYVQQLAADAKVLAQQAEDLLEEM